jgi:hypothetical protein
MELLLGTCSAADSQKDGTFAPGGPSAALALLSVVDHALSQLRASLSATEASAAAAELSQLRTSSQRLGDLLASGSSSGPPQPPQPPQTRSDGISGDADNPSRPSAAQRRESLGSSSSSFGESAALALDSDVSPLSVLFRARCHDIMEKLDLDGDGKISLDELFVASRGLGMPDHKAREVAREAAREWRRAASGCRTTR